MEYLYFAIGLILGSITTILFICRKCGVGALKIDHSNPEKDLYRFEIDEIEDLSERRVLILKIDNNADLSQK